MRYVRKIEVVQQFPFEPCTQGIPVSVALHFVGGPYHSERRTFSVTTEDMQMRRHMSVVQIALALAQEYIDNCEDLEWGIPACIEDVKKFWKRKADRIKRANQYR